MPPLQRLFLPRILLLHHFPPLPPAPTTTINGLLPPTNQRELLPRYKYSTLGILNQGPGTARIRRYSDINHSQLVRRKIDDSYFPTAIVTANHPDNPPLLPPNGNTDYTIDYNYSVMSSPSTTHEGGDTNNGYVPPLIENLPPVPTHIKSTIVNVLGAGRRIFGAREYQINTIFQFAYRKHNIYLIRIRKCGE